MAVELRERQSVPTGRENGNGRRVGTIEAIVSDLGQVVLPFDVERAWSAILPRCAAPAAAVRERLPRLVSESGLCCGRVTGPEFYERLAECTGLRMPYEEFVVAWSDMFSVDDEVVRMIREAPVRRRVLLSNTNELHWAWITRQYAEPLAAFDTLLVSHECGLEKPAPEIYERVLRETGLPSEAHLFIDDLKENVLGARAACLQAVRHTSAASLRREFARRGLLRRR